MQITLTASMRRFVMGAFLVDAWEVCAENNGSVVSGLRSPTHNRDVGGSGKSRHTYRYGWGLAVDAHFGSEADRDAAVREMERRGWFSYVGEDYAPTQAHFQGFPAGIPLPDR